jgi:peptide/nickel transport system substrate-binding protein
MNFSRSISAASKFWLASLVGLALLLSLTIGCGSDEPSSATISPTAAPVATTAVSPKASQGPTYGGNLRLAVNLGMKSLDALHPSGEYREQYAFFSLYNSIVEADKDFVPTPSLADSWVISDDGKAVTIYLKRGVQFHDGTSFDAQSVKWFLDNIVLDDFGSRLKANFKPFIDKVDVVDQYTVTVHTVKPWRPLIGHATLAWFRFPSPTAYLGYSSQRDGKLWLGPNDPYARNPVGTGPFMLEEWIPDSHLTLVKNPNYWEDGKPYLDKITFENVPQKSSQLAAIRTGAAELVDDVFGPDIPVLEGSDNVKIIPYVTKRWWSVVFDTNVEPFNNKALRQAVAYGLDREEIVKVHFEGQGGPAYMAGVGWYDDPDWRIYEHSADKAKEKLAEAGYPDGITIPFWCEQSEVEIRLCEIEQAMLKEVGIELDLKPVPPSDWWADIAKGNIDFGRMAYYPRPDPDWVLRSILHSKGFYTGVASYSNPEVDKLIDDAVGIFDTSIAGPMYIQAQKIVFEDAPYISLYNEKVFVALNKKVHNFIWIPDTLLRLRELWIEK